MVHQDRDIGQDSSASFCQDIPSRFLLFDRQAIYVKDYVVFKESPGYEDLVNQLKNLRYQAANERVEHSLKGEHLAEELAELRHKLNCSQSMLDKMRRDVKNPLGICTKVYQLLRPISFPFVEFIFPYQSNCVKREELLRQAKVVKRELKGVKKYNAEEEEKMENKGRLTEVQLEQLIMDWIFSSRERVLLHAFTYLYNSPQERDILLTQYARAKRVDIGYIISDYEKLERFSHLGQLEPGFSPRVDPQLVLEEGGKAVAKSIPENQTNDGSNFTDFLTVSTDPDHSICAPTTSKRDVIFITSGGNKVLLNELTEDEIDKLSKRSGTPIEHQKLKMIIEQLAISDDPIKEYQHHPRTATGGDYSGFHKIFVGKIGRVLFKYNEGQVFIHFGTYFRVYGSRKQNT